MALLKMSMGMALGALLMSPVRAWPAASDAEPALEVDLGPQASPTPLPPTPTSTPTDVPTLAPTVAPTSAASPAVTGAAAPGSPTAQGSQDLGEVHFEKSQAPDSEDGLMIIAPGAATAEDSLESFGIDSPFNWKGKDRTVLQPGKAVAGEESLELEAPDSSDLKEQVRVETSEGAELPTDADYDQVERVGAVLGPSEYHVDGTLARTKDGQYFAHVGTVVALRMEPGRQVYPGSIYTVFRDFGTLQRPSDQQDVGLLVRNVGVLKVVRIEGEDVLARVEKQYDRMGEGDLVHLRDPDRLRYYNSVRQGPSNVPLDLKGEVLAVPPNKIVAKAGEVVYLDLGRAQGLAPGSKLTIIRPAEEVGADGIRPLLVTGRLGQVVVVNVSHDACVARVLHANGEVRVGDQVSYR